ncbi:hypothetical protein Godav_014058 [Gossypium davidsonii]|uniref:Uncharacterized protein n=2 Tax=Gossypium davidsonii TaxID=34287 RepID=A0A7J8RJD0_GOSDV|nr:hypothetical protein [Gossypium davidsonii]
MLRIHDLECYSRPPLTGPKRPTYNFQDVAFAPYGHYWKEIRKICVAELFRLKRVQSLQSVREEEVDLLIESVSGSATLANPIDLSKCSFSLTASTIFRIVFSKQFQGSELDNDKLQKLVFEAEAMLESFCASDFLPYVGKAIDWFTSFRTRLESSFHELDSFFQRVIEDHLDSGLTKDDEEDLVDVLLRMEKDQIQNDAIQLTKDHIKAILMLARKPTAMKKAQNEIRSCVEKKGKLTENNVSKLTYLNMVIKKTLRLNPPGVLLLPRETMSQIKIGYYDINPKTRIAVNVWAIGRDPDIWVNPEEFIPERFIDNPINLKGKLLDLVKQTARFSKKLAQQES